MASTNEPVFSPGYRASGVLLHVSSLPSPFGIGDMGPAALEWMDRLAEANQSWWQILPLGPTGYGNSPYSSVSSFAGNWLLMSPEELKADGLLPTEDLATCSFSQSTVDYETVSTLKNRLLESVCQKFSSSAGKKLKPAFEQFCTEQIHWLEDYALFEALKGRYAGVSYLQWPAELVQRKPKALAKARRELAASLDKIRLAQFLVYRQGKRLKELAHARGLRLIGDLPFFVASDSCDVWAHPELFQLDNQYRPEFVAGVPPDYFSAEGQLWGNPVYNWESLRQTGYRWCIERVRTLLTYVDVIRLDHFRGFAAAWHVPAGEKTARVGDWVPGPGADFFNAVLRELGALPFIAEDLGIITADVPALRDQFNLPGTRVLQFAFDGKPDSPHLPHNFVPNTVVYTGTHDNNTTRGWYKELPGSQRQSLCQYLHRSRILNTEAAAALLSLAWKSVAALAIAPLQDFLNLGAEARMNVPGLAEGNWRWRCTKEMYTGSAFAQLQDLTTVSNRSPLLPHSANQRSESRGSLSK